MGGGLGELEGKGDRGEGRKLIVRYWLGWLS